LRKTLPPTLFILALSLCLCSCSTKWKPQKDPMIRVTAAHVADGASTGLAMLLQGAAEGNPLGWGVIPVRIGATYGIIPFLEPKDQCVAANIASDITFGAAANNLAIAAGASSSIALPVGFAVVMPYLLACDFRYLNHKACPWKETVSEEMDRRIKAAEKRGRPLFALVLNCREINQLESEIGFVPMVYKGIVVKGE